MTPQQAVDAAIAVKSAPQAKGRTTPQEPGTAQPGMSAARMSPGSLWIPSLDAYGRVDPAHIASGELELPDNPKQLSLWSDGAPVSSTTGTTLISGHVRAGGQRGTLAHLADVTPGSLIYVKDTDATLTRWVVTALGVHEVEKAKLPAWVWAGPTGPRRLVLVTCGGPWLTTGHYRDNILVTAVPVTGGAA